MIDNAFPAIMTQSTATRPFRHPITIALPLILLCAASLHAQEKGLTFTRLAGNFYIYTTCKPVNGVPFPSNGMYVVTDRGIIMIDTPWDVTKTEPLLDSMKRRHGKDVIMCIVTHSHDDRTAGLDILKSRGIATYSTEMTYQLCREKSEKEAEFHLAHDTTFTVGGVNFQTFYPGPGHTRDNIVIWFPKERILYGGCFVKSPESRGLGNIADADLARWPASVRNVVRKFKHPAVIIPGHQGWRGGNALQHTLKLLRESGKK